MAMQEVLFEFHRVGAYVKVTALDPKTGIETSIVGDAKAGEFHLKQTAFKKLQYVLAKEAGK